MSTASNLCDVKNSELIFLRDQNIANRNEHVTRLIPHTGENYKNYETPDFIPLENDKNDEKQDILNVAKSTTPQSDYDVDNISESDLIFSDVDDNYSLILGANELVKKFKLKDSELNSNNQTSAVTSASTSTVKM